MQNSTEFQREFALVPMVTKQIVCVSRKVAGMGLTTVTFDSQKKKEKKQTNSDIDDLKFSIPLYSSLIHS